MAPFDVITMGRVSVDLYPQQVHATLPEVRGFSKSLGGSPTNVAVAAARLGRKATVITKVGARRSPSARSTRPTTSRCSSTASPRRRT